MRQAPGCRWPSRSNIAEPARSSRAVAGRVAEAGPEVRAGPAPSETPRRRAAPAGIQKTRRRMNTVWEAAPLETRPRPYFLKRAGMRFDTQSRAMKRAKHEAVPTLAAMVPVIERPNAISRAGWAGPPTTGAWNAEGAGAARRRRRKRQPTSPSRAATRQNSAGRDAHVAIRHATESPRRQAGSAQPLPPLRHLSPRCLILPARSSWRSSWRATAEAGSASCETW